MSMLSMSTPLEMFFIGCFMIQAQNVKTHTVNSDPPWGNRMLSGLIFLKFSRQLRVFAKVDRARRAV